MIGFLRRRKIKAMKMMAYNLKRQLEPMHTCLSMFNSEGKGDHDVTLRLRREIAAKEIRLRHILDACSKLDRPKT